MILIFEKDRWHMELLRVALTAYILAVGVGIPVTLALCNGTSLEASTSEVAKLLAVSWSTAGIATLLRVVTGYMLNEVLDGGEST